MTKTVHACGLSDSLNHAAYIMWERDCGAVPVIDEQSRVVGIITDRDICMGAYTQGRALADVPVSSVCSRNVVTCRPWESLDRAEALMRQHRVRRIVVTDDGGVLLGLLSISDLARHLQFVASAGADGLGASNIALVVEAVSKPRALENGASHGPTKPSAVVVSAG